MAKITRKNQKIFGQNALSGQIGVFGSLAAGSPATTTDPETIQSLSNYLAGWFSGVVGSNSPAIEDVNALAYLYSYQLAYLMQAGIPEYNANTTYYIGSFVQSAGVIYQSITDNNISNAVSNGTYWQKGLSETSLLDSSISASKLALGNSGRMNFLSKTTTYSAVIGDYVSCSGTFTVTLPTAVGVSGQKICIKNIGSGKITIATTSSQTIDQYNSLSLCSLNDYVELISNGSNWFSDVCNISVKSKYYGCTSSISSTLATMTYTTKLFDSHSAYSGGVYTLPMSGEFQINAGIFVQATFSASNANYISIFNGATEITRTYLVIPPIPGSGSNIQYVMISDTIIGNIGDQITIKAGSSGGSPSVSNSVPVTNYFTISKIGN
jgi:hypothetical protein